jgi:uncharacterized membrane protein YczE
MTPTEKEQFVEILKAVAVDLFFLITGIVLVGLGSNFYLAFGLAALLVYHKSTGK